MSRSITPTHIQVGTRLAPDETERNIEPFKQWLPKNFPKPQWTWEKPHLKLIQIELAKMKAGEFSHLLILMPPRHGKSELTTIRWPAWNIEMDPTTLVVIGAYNKDFATTFSGQVRDMVADIPSIRIKRDTKKKADWKTWEGGGVLASGVGVPPTGRGANILIVDDPVKDREEANSPTYRQKVWTWFTQGLYTRREPGCLVVVIMTQWHDDDLAGRLLSRPEWEKVFKVLRIPAIAETKEERKTYNSRFHALRNQKKDLVGRKPGAALWPERFNKKELEGLRRKLGRGFSALYQQRPQPIEGGQFKREYFGSIIPGIANDVNARFVRYWDKAASKGKYGSYSVGLLMRELKGLYTVVDVQRGRWSATEREEIIKSTAMIDDKVYGQGRVAIWIEQEGGSGGKESAEGTVKNLGKFGIKVNAETATGAKDVRAEPYEAACGAMLVSLVAGKWNNEYIEEMVNFELHAKFTDQADASSGAFNKLVIGLVDIDSLRGDNLDRGDTEIMDRYG